MNRPEISENLLEFFKTDTTKINLKNRYRNVVSDNLMPSKKYYIFMKSGRLHGNNTLWNKADMCLTPRSLNNSFGDEHLDELREFGAIIWWNE